jgi:tetratricopeptide (TPR) repeat protein
MNTKRQNHLQIIFLIAVVAVVYTNTLAGGFVRDDNVFVLGIKAYRDFSISGLFFSVANTVEYLPVRDLSYAIDFMLWGEKAAGFHFTNILIHCAATISLYHLAKQMQKNLLWIDEPIQLHQSIVPFAAALLFAVHPIQSHSASWIGARNVLISGFFFFLSCHLFLRYRELGRSGYYLGAFLCFVCALLSKSTAIVLPLILLLFTFFEKERNKQKIAVLLLPFFTFSVCIYVIFKKVALNANLIDRHTDILTLASILKRVAVALQIPFFYLSKLFIPVGFAADYDVEFTSRLTDLKALAAMAGIALLVLLALYCKRRAPEVSFGLSWYFISLIPVLNLFATSPVVSDRYAYIPLSGLYFAIATLLSRYLSSNTPRIFVATWVIIVISLSLLAFHRNSIWKNNVTLWEDAVKSAPKLHSNHLYLADIYYEKGNFGRALVHYAKARELNPSSDGYDIAQGRLALEKGDVVAAVSAFNQALARNEESLRALQSLGVIYSIQGDYERALEMYERMGKSRQVNYGGIRLVANQEKERLLKLLSPGLERLRRKISEKPSDIELRGELVLKLYHMGLKSQAHEEYRQLLNLGNNTWQFHYIIGNINLKMGNYIDAANAFEKSLVINPQNAFALNNLGVAFQGLKEYEKSVAPFTRAISVDNKNPYAPLNLAITYITLKDKQNALRYLSVTRERFPELAPKVEVYEKMINQ